MLTDCEGGNPRVCELANRIKKGLKASRKRRKHR
jgi:hypothetical protein